MIRTKKPLTQKPTNTASKRGKKVSVRTKTAPSSQKEKKPVASKGFSHDSIALRAYFISERRRELGKAGNEIDDWLEAEKQFLSETPLE